MKFPAFLNHEETKNEPLCTPEQHHYIVTINVAGDVRSVSYQVARNILDGNFDEIQDTLFDLCGEVSNCIYEGETEPPIPGEGWKKKVSNEAWEVLENAGYDLESFHLRLAEMLEEQGIPINNRNNKGFQAVMIILINKVAAVSLGAKYKITAKELMLTPEERNNVVKRMGEKAKKLGIEVEYIDQEEEG